MSKENQRELDTNKENMIEFLSGERFTVVTFTNRKHINRIKKLYETRSNEFKYLHENDDGSVCAKIPLKWIKINPGSDPAAPKRSRSMTDQQKRDLVERLQAGRLRNK